KEEYPDATPLADGFEAQSMLNYASHAFGTKAGWGFGDGMIDNGGEFVYAATTDEYKQMVEFFRTLVEEGLLDRESLTASNDGSGAAGVDEKFANETCFAASGSSGTAIEFAQALNETVGEGNHDVALIPPPAGPAGENIEPRNFWHGFMLSSQITQSENFLATLQFVDWLYFNPEARDMLRWGEKDVHFTKADDGSIELKPEFSLDDYAINPDGETDIKVDLGYSTFPAESTESRALKESYSTDAFVQYIDDVLTVRTPRDPYPPAPLDESELEQASLLATPIKDAVDTATLKFIMGERDMSEWDAFLGELEAAGLPRYLELLRGARKRSEAGTGGAATRRRSRRWAHAQCGDPGGRGAGACAAAPGTQTASGRVEACTAAGLAAVHLRHPPADLPGDLPVRADARQRDRLPALPARREHLRRRVGGNPLRRHVHQRPRVLERLREHGDHRRDDPRG